LGGELVCCRIYQFYKFYEFFGIFHSHKTRGTRISENPVLLCEQKIPKNEEIQKIHRFVNTPILHSNIALKPRNEYNSTTYFTADIRRTNVNWCLCAPGREHGQVLDCNDNILAGLRTHASGWVGRSMLTCMVIAMLVFSLTGSLGQPDSGDMQSMDYCTKPVARAARGSLRHKKTRIHQQRLLQLLYFKLPRMSSRNPRNRREKRQ
jgi:hypothetical protein